MTMPAPPTPGVEMTLAQFLDSKWARRISRGTWIILGAVIPLGGGTIGYMVYDSRAKADQAVVAAAQVKDVQAARIVDQERFQAAVLATVGEIKSTVGDLASTLSEVQIDAARTRGIVEQMQRQQSREALFFSPRAPVE